MPKSTATRFFLLPLDVVVQDTNCVDHQLTSSQRKSKYSNHPNAIKIFIYISILRFYSVYYQVVSSVLALFIDFAVGLNRMTVLLVLHRQLMSLPKSDKNLKQLKRQIGLHTVSLDRLRQIGLHLRLLTKNRPLADKFRRQLPLN